LVFKILILKFKLIEFEKISVNPAILFIIGLLYGLSLAAPPGPILALMAQRTLVSFFNGVAVGLGAMTADFTFMIITLMLYNFVASLFLYPFYLVGALFMLYLAYSTLKIKRNNFSMDMNLKRKTNSYFLGLGIGLINPLQIGWWLTAGLSFISLFGIVSVIGFFIGIVIWVLFFAYMVRKGYMINKGLAFTAIKIFSLATFLFFAGYFLYNATYELWKVIR